MQDKYFEYLFSDEYMSPGYNNINENLLVESTLGYEKDVVEFGNLRIDDVLPLMYVTESMSYEDAVLLESAYIQYTKHLNEFMGTGNHLYGNQIGVGATDWMSGVDGPLKWLGSLLAGTLAGLFALLAALIRKGKQLIGVALLKRYITKIAAITDDGYKRICGLFTSPRNRACFRTFQEASERDIIVSTDTCAKALGLLNNTLEYNPEDQNPYNQAEELISDVHDEYLKDITVSRGFFGFNKLIDKPSEKIENTNDYAEKYNIRIKNAYTTQQLSNHQDEETFKESFNYAGYDSLNEYKSEPEHYGNTEDYTKNIDAYLVAVRAAWENLCKRLIGEVRIGEEVEYLKQNKDLNLPQGENNGRSKSAPSKFKNFIASTPPQDDLEAWLRGLVKYCYRVDDNKIDKIFIDFSTDDIDTKNTWKQIQGAYRFWKRNTTSENMNELWARTKKLLKKIKINESVLYTKDNILNEAGAGEGVNTWRNEDIDNNLIAQMSNWIQRVPKTEWKITTDFKKKCTELALAVDKEIIAKINRWTVPSGAPGMTGTSGKGYNSPITKAGLEKLWAAYKEELDKRLEARVDKFVTSKPFDYGLQFLQFTVPSLMKDVLNKVSPNEQQRNVVLLYNYEVIADKVHLENIHTGEDGLTAEISNWEDFPEDILNINIQELKGGSLANESFISYKGIEFKLFEYDEENMPEEDDDTTSLDSEENQEQQEIKIDGYSVAYTIMDKNDVVNALQALNSYIKDNCAVPGKNMRAGYPILKQKGEGNSLYKNAEGIFKQVFPGDIEFSMVYKNFETNETVSPYLNDAKLILKPSIITSIQKELTPKDASNGALTDNENEDEGSILSIDDLVFVKFPIFYYGNMIIDKSEDIKPDWVIENLSEENKNILKGESSEDKKDNTDSELSVYWPIKSKDVSKVLPSENGNNPSGSEKNGENKPQTDQKDNQADKSNTDNSTDQEWVPPLPKDEDPKKAARKQALQDNAEDTDFEEIEDEKDSGNFKSDSSDEKQKEKSDEESSEKKDKEKNKVNDSLQFNYAAYDSIFEDGGAPLTDPSDLDDNNTSPEESEHKNVPATLQDVYNNIDDSYKKLEDAHKKELDTTDDKEEKDEKEDNIDTSGGSIYKLNEKLNNAFIIILDPELGEKYTEEDYKCDVIINSEGNKEYVTENETIDANKIPTDEASHPLKVIFKNAVTPLPNKTEEKGAVFSFESLQDYIDIYNDYLYNYINSLSDGEAKVDIPKQMDLTLNLNRKSDTINHILDDNLNKYKDAGISYKEILIKKD